MNRQGRPFQQGWLSPKRANFVQEAKCRGIARHGVHSDEERVARHEGVGVGLWPTFDDTPNSIHDVKAHLAPNGVTRDDFGDRRIAAALMESGRVLDKAVREIFEAAREGRHMVGLDERDIDDRRRLIQRRDKRISPGNTEIDSLVLPSPVGLFRCSEHRRVRTNGLKQHQLRRTPPRLLKRFHQLRGHRLSCSDVLSSRLVEFDKNNVIRFQDSMPCIGHTILAGNRFDAFFQCILEDGAVDHADGHHVSGICPDNVSNRERARRFHGVLRRHRSNAPQVAEAGRSAGTNRAADELPPRRLPGIGP